MRLLWWLLTVIGVGLISITLSHQGALDPIQNFSLRITSPAERGLHDLASPIADFFQGIVDRGELARENRRLQAEIERLKADIARLENAQQRYEELAALLAVKEGRPQDEFVVANVIAQDPSNLKEAIAIDRGTSDGVEEGMVVLGPGGSLVGTVSRAYPDFAWVTLTTDPDSAVNAQVTQAEARGVVSGDLRRGLVLDLVSQSAQLQEGLLVTTSGLGGNYPQALLIGTIRSVDYSPQDLFQKATLEPAIDFSHLERVLVMVSFTPARLVGP